MNEKAADLLSRKPLKNRSGHLPLKNKDALNRGYFGIIVIKFGLPAPPLGEGGDKEGTQKEKLDPTNVLGELWPSSPVRKL